MKDLLEGDLRELIVLSGPLKGLRYPSAKSLNSCLFPKLLGTYELELHSLIERLFSSKSYDVIVDVGAAEGYYAVGFAILCPQARVFAYDIDPTSKVLIHDLALANDVANRVEFEYKCTGPTLVRLAQQFQRGLLISDCEGYEIDLMQQATIAALSRFDMLIETHDHYDNNRITSEIRKRASSTHKVSVIKRRRRTLHDFPDLPDLHRSSAMIRLAAMNEGRTWRSKWLCCESLSN